jgi:trypsin
MKRCLIIFVVCLMPISLLSQKVTVMITKAKEASASGWQILDDQFFPVFSGYEYLREDTVILALEADKRYFLEISVSRINIPDSSLYSLWINNVAIMRINSDIEPGDHFYSFFTGTASEKQAKITGGTNTDISEFPWQIYLEAGNYTCGGSIIARNWIITAAHCTKGDFNETIPASEMVVTVGANNPRISTQGKDYLVSEVIVHELFDGNTLENDIALLRLTESINFTNAAPIKLVSANDAVAGFTDPGVLSWITGYGLTRVRPATYPSALQKVQLPIITNTQASTVWDKIPATDLMAGYENGNKDACIGDSGGPLVVPVSNGYKLAGLVSWGSSNCNTYGAYTRVSLFESWITEKTGIEITFSAPRPIGDSIICPGITSSVYHVNSVAGVTAYNWLLLPEAAGTISGNSETASVAWNQGYSGKANVYLQIMRNSEASEISQLTVNIAKNTRLLSQSGDTVMCAEQPLALKMNAEGYNLNYTWYRNNNLIKSGGSNEINILSSGASDSGTYYSEIKGSCGTSTSRTFNLTVLPVTKINNITPDTEVAFGDDINLEVNTEGHELEFQWQKDGKTLETGNAADFVKLNVNANDIGLYKVKVTGTCGTETSKDIYVYVKSKYFSKEPEVFVWPTVINDEFRVALSNDQNYNVLLYNTIGNLIRETTNCRYETVINISKLPAGIYIIKVYNDNFRKSIKLIKR